MPPGTVGTACTRRPRPNWRRRRPWSETVRRTVQHRYTASDGPRPSVSSTTHAGPQTSRWRPGSARSLRAAGRSSGSATSSSQQHRLRPAHLHDQQRPARLRSPRHRRRTSSSPRVSSNDGNWHHRWPRWAPAASTSMSTGSSRRRPTFTTAETKPATGRSAWTTSAAGPTTPSCSQNKSFTGAIDDVAVYGSELTPAQVSAHYAARQ